MFDIKLEYKYDAFDLSGDAKVNNRAAEEGYDVDRWLTKPELYYEVYNTRAYTHNFYLRRSVRIKGEKQEKDRVSIYYNLHSTNCCGLKTLYFGGQRTEHAGRADRIPEQVTYDLIKTHKERYIEAYNSNTHSICIDAVLTQQQIQLKSWLCKTFGFKEMYSFVSANSGNTCSYLLLQMDKDYKLPV